METECRGDVMDRNEKRLLTPEETANILGMSVKTLYTRTAPKAKRPLGLKAKRLGHSLRFYSQDVIKFMEDL